VSPVDHPPRRSLALLFLVFAGGATSLGTEIAAARLLAPYFGASTVIWANTIAVVLVALSIGYWFGGRVADRHPTQRALRLAVLGACVLLAAVPLAAGPFFDVVVRAFDTLNAGAFLGSLGGVLVLVALPLLLLGTVAPWAVRLAVHDVAQAGEVSGRLYAISTLGSLTGVFAAALVLVPQFGTQRTFILLAAALALVAAIVHVPRRALLVPAGLAALLLVPPGATRPAEAGTKVLSERESQYQYVRVVQRGDRRTLELNEGQAEHSVFRPSTTLTGGYWDGYLVMPFAGLDHPPRRMAMLGNAGGTISRAYGRFFPGTVIDGVEIDRKVSEAGRRYFGLTENPRLNVVTEDARPFLRRTDERYDVIGVDAYRQPYIPFYLMTREFFALAASRLTPGGVVVVNVGHAGGADNSLEKVIAATMRTQLPNVMRFPIEAQSTLLVASRAPLSAGRMRAALARHLRGPLAPLGQRAAAELRPAPAGGDVYTDDRAPVEWLIDASIVRYAADSGK